MRAFALGVAAVLVAGCATGGDTTASKQELDIAKRELAASVDTRAAQLSERITASEEKYAQFQQLANDVKAKLAQLEKLEKQMAQANLNVVRLLEFEEKLMAERLATLRAMLEELKK
jgi:coenzyme F420-reducing hydrogenase delta subunit